MTPDESFRPWPGRRAFPIFYHDIDVLNHLNHVAYLRFMETLRCDYYLPLLGTQDPRKIDGIVAEATCRYLAPVVYGQTILGEIAPSKEIGRTSFVFFYRFRDPERGETVYARGRTVIVNFDYAKGEKKPLSDAQRSKLARDAIDAVEAGWD